MKTKIQYFNNEKAIKIQYFCNKRFDDMEIKLYYIDPWYIEKMKRLNPNGRFSKINLKTALGYVFDMEDEENTHQLYCIPFITDDLDMLVSDNQEVINRMFPISKEFLSEFDANYIDDEQEREELRSELLRYDERAKEICANAKSLYKQGRIKKDCYYNYGKRLKQLEDEAYLVLQRYYRNINRNKSNSLTYTVEE